jgi:hypothetical protein
MGLILKVVGVLAGGLAVARMLARRSPSLKRRPMAAVGLAAALVAAVLFVYHVYEIGSGLPEATRASAAVTPFVAQHAGDLNANNAFLVWAQQVMAAHTTHRGTYYLEPETLLANAELGQWSTYVLLPERATTKLGEAEWIVFYGVEPSLSAEQRRQFGSISEFAPGYALASRSHAS